MSRALLTLFWLVGACGCSHDETAAGTTTPDTCAAPNRRVGNRRVGDLCLEPGVQDDGCPAGTVGVDGTCQPAGIPADRCAMGFEPVGDGCEPILPTAPCPEGELAVPGETACHEVMPCGQGRWGDIAGESTTQFVDASYAGGDSDGTENKPWTTVGEAVDAASEGAIVAVAAGSYVEELAITKGLRVYGRCPSMVEIVGSVSASTVTIAVTGSGSELRGLAVRRGGAGVVVSNAAEVTLDRLWIRDTQVAAVQVNSSVGPARATIVGSLFERNHNGGLTVSGAEVRMESSVVRDALSMPSTPLYGRAVDAMTDMNGIHPTAVELSRVLLDSNLEGGLVVNGATARVEGSVVRNSLPAEQSLRYGRGIHVEAFAGIAASLEVNGTLVEGNRESGIYVLGADATIENSTVRGTLPQESNDQWGHGITVWDRLETVTRSNVLLRSLVVDGNHSVGIIVAGSDAIIEGVIVRGTLPEPVSQDFGLGLTVQKDFQMGAPASAQVRGSRIEGNLLAAAFVHTADLSIEGSALLTTQKSPLDGTRGDGIDAVLPTTPVQVATSVLQSNARAGYAVFDGIGTLRASRLECNPIALAIEGQGARIEDLGSNICLCEAVDECKALSAGLEPPAPLMPSE